MRSIWKILATFAILVLGVAGGASAQELKEKSIKDQIVGAWWVVSVVNETDGKRSTPFSTNPKGLFSFTIDGHFTINIVNPQSAASDENRGAMQFGNYTMNTDGSITLEIVGNTFPNGGGAKQRRVIQINGDEMKWIDPKGSSVVEVIVLQRAKIGDHSPSVK